MGANPHNTSYNEREITSFVLVEEVTALLFIMPPPAIRQSLCFSIPLPCEMKYLQTDGFLPPPQ